MFEGVAGDRAARADPQLGADRAQVRIDGTQADEEFSATWASVRPVATRRSTSTSRGVSPAGWVAGSLELISFRTGARSPLREPTGT